MMVGYIANLHAMLPIILRLIGRPDFSIDFVIDTGFMDFLTLPPAAVAALGLPFKYDLPISLANNSHDVVAVHAATILWHGVERNVNVLATGVRPLLGTALLADNELITRFVNGGQVVVNP